MAYIEGRLVHDADSQVDINERAEWVAAFQTAAQAEGIPTAMWDFATSFRAYDQQANAWIQVMLTALLG